MTKNPFLNALAATLYIVLVSIVMNLGSKFAPREDSVIAPIAVISLFSLSAAVMGYLFGFEPAQLYFGGKKKEAVQLFLQTTAVFALFTAVFLSLLFTGIFG